MTGAGQAGDRAGRRFSPARRAPAAAAFTVSGLTVTNRLEKINRFDRMRLEVNEGVEATASHVDTPALDRINAILSDPEWGVGMLEDICAIVRGTGRDEVAGARWERH